MNIYVRDLRAPSSALCVFDQEVLCTVLMQAGSLAPSERAGSCSSGGEAWTALSAGSVRSPAKPRRRDLCQCRIGAVNGKKHILQMSEGMLEEADSPFSCL